MVLWYYHGFVILSVLWYYHSFVILAWFCDTIIVLWYYQCCDTIIVLWYYHCFMTPIKLNVLPMSWSFCIQAFNILIINSALRYLVLNSLSMLWKGWQHILVYNIHRITHFWQTLKTFFYSFHTLLIFLTFFNFEQKENTKEQCNLSATPFNMYLSWLVCLHTQTLNVCLLT